MARRGILQPGEDHGCLPSHRPAVFHFFKIILSTTSEQNKLLLPSKFVEKCGDELGDFADLMVPNGSVWKVRILKGKNKIWFNEGWKSFADHHSIGYGHFLVFAYTGLCSFKVVIFDKTASEILYPCNNQTPNRERRNEVKTPDDLPSEALNSGHSSLNSKVPEARAKKRDSSEIHTKPEQKPQVKRSRGSASMASPVLEQFDTRNKKPKVEPFDETIDIDDNDTIRKNPRKYEHLEKNRAKYEHALILSTNYCCQNSKPFCVCIAGKPKSSGECKDREAEIVSSKMYQCSKAIPNSKKALAAAKKFTPKRPSFMVLLKKYIRDTRMYVPRRFVPYLNDAPEFIKLRVPDGREWKVQLFRVGNKRTDIGSGWTRFMRDNNLKVGDVCVFELMENKEVLKVSIFRASKDVKLEHSHTK